MKPMPHILPSTAQSALMVGRTPGRTPRSAADAPVGFRNVDQADFPGEKRVQGDPSGPVGLPHHSRAMAALGIVFGLTS